MMDWTDRHCRMFHRQLTRHALLYSEMVTALAIRHGDRERLLGFSPAERPVALQIGGSEPGLLAEAAKWGEDYGYAEINLNVGCPSDRVQSGRFGACLMAEPDLVARCVAAMKAAVSVPVTVKCRLGIDEQDTGAPLDNFADLLLGAGVEGLYVHARKAWLKGLSPKENRTIPPLDYPRVHRLAARLEVPVMINGGIETLAAAHEHLQKLEGVMLGRAAYHDPVLLARVDHEIFGEPETEFDLRPVIEAMAAYTERQLSGGARLNQITRHMLGLANGRRGARQFRQLLSVEACKPGAGPDVLFRALDALGEKSELAA